MDNSLAVPRSGLAVTSTAAKYIERSKSANTLRAYRSDWRQYSRWCESRGLCALPSDVSTVIDYLAYLAESGRAYATISRRVVSIARAHAAAGIDSPTKSALVREVLSGIAATIGTAQTGVPALRISDLRRVVYNAPDTLRGTRDKAILLLGYVLAARRSELAALDVSDVTFTAAGMEVTIRHSKTDRAGQGARFGIARCSASPALCPVAAVGAWLTSSGLTSGPLFRGIDRHGHLLARRIAARTISEVIAAHVPGCSGHSLRAGFVTDQYAAGTQEAVIADRSRHRSRSVLGRYRREADLFAFDYLGAVL